MRSITPGSIDISVYFMLRDSADGTAKTGLLFNSAGAVGSYVRNRGARVAITLATLASPSAAYADGGFKEVDGTNQKGVYRLDLPDAAVAIGSPIVNVTLEFDGVFVETLEIPIGLPVDVQEINADSGAAASLATAINTDDNLVDVNVKQVDDSALAAADLEDLALNGYDSANNRVFADVKAIMTSVTAANNLEGFTTADPSGISANIKALGDQTEALVTMQALYESVIVKANVITGTLTATKFTTDLTEVTDDHYKGQVIAFGNSSALIGQARFITAYDGTTKEITVAPPLTDAPSNADDILILPSPESLANNGTTTPGTAITGTLSTTQFTTDFTEATDAHYENMMVVFTSGALKGQGRYISGYMGSNKLITVSPAFTEAPANTDTFIVGPVPETHPDSLGTVNANITQVDGVAVVDDGAGRLEADVSSAALSSIDSATNQVAIKAKTDNLPVDPASEANVDANEAKIDIVDTVVDAIKAITDQMTFSSGLIDSRPGAIAAAAVTSIDAELSSNHGAGSWDATATSVDLTPAALSSIDNNINQLAIKTQTDKTPSILLGLSDKHYYVDSTNGLAINDGSYASPFKKPSEAKAVVKAGDWVHIVDSTTVIADGLVDWPVYVTVIQESNDDLVNFWTPASQAYLWKFQAGCKIIRIKASNISSKPNIIFEETGFLGKATYEEEFCALSRLRMELNFAHAVIFSGASEITTVDWNGALINHIVSRNAGIQNGIGGFTAVNLNINGGTFSVPGQIVFGSLLIDGVRITTDLDLSGTGNGGTISKTTIEGDLTGGAAGGGPNLGTVDVTESHIHGNVDTGRPSTDDLFLNIGDGCTVKGNVTLRGVNVLSAKTVDGNVIVSAEATGVMMYMPRIRGTLTVTAGATNTFYDWIVHNGLTDAEGTSKAGPNVYDWDDASPGNDWSATEKANIRDALGVDGTQTPGGTPGDVQGILTDTAAMQPLIDAAITTRSSHSANDVRDAVLNAAAASFVAGGSIGATLLEVWTSLFGKYKLFNDGSDGNKLKLQFYDYAGATLKIADIFDKAGNPITDLIDSDAYNAKSLVERTLPA